MSGRRHPGVDAYIGALLSWQRDLCQELRELILAADPDITETTTRTVQPCSVLEGNVCALLAAKDHVNLFLYDPTVPDPAGVINQGHGNETARAIQTYQGDHVNRAAISAIVQAIAERNRAGGWRQLNKKRVTATQTIAEGQYAGRQ
jgi:hypothetical protein